MLLFFSFTTGTVELAPKIGEQHQAAVTLQENMTYWFKCHSDGLDTNPPPLLTWYLNGEQQIKSSPYHGCLVRTHQDGSEAITKGTNCNSTFSLKARKWDMELVCVASYPRTGENYNATMTLNVQCGSSVNNLK